jgi:1-acyl-sn-glycerol-3-phosphate acyltransferase
MWRSNDDLGWRPPSEVVGPIEPSASTLRRNDAIVRWGGWAARLAARPWVESVDVRGREHLRAGPLLVMMNHTNVLDPILLTAHARRPIQFLVTEPAMSMGLSGRLASWWGQVPKRKLDADTRSFRMLKAWCRVGGVVGLFPEGQLTWDGHPLPLKSGLQQLISYLDVPVVTVRLTNGDRLWPAWAEHPRRTKLRIDIDPPKRFEPGEPVERHVAERLHVDPDTCTRWPVRGLRLAAGLARFLRYCPACGAADVLADRGNRLSCAICRRQWAVTADNRLSSALASMSIAEALREAQGHWREQWRRTERFRSRGPVNVIDVGRREPVLVATGVLSLEGGRLRTDGWELAMDDVLAHMLDWDERIVLRTQRRRLALRMPHDSRAIWSLAFDQTMSASTPS